MTSSRATGYFVEHFIAENISIIRTRLGLFFNVKYNVKLFFFRNFKIGFATIINAALYVSICKLHGTHTPIYIFRF